LKQVIALAEFRLYSQRHDSYPSLLLMNSGTGAFFAAALLVTASFVLAGAARRRFGVTALD